MSAASTSSQTSVVRSSSSTSRRKTAGEIGLEFAVRETRLALADSCHALAERLQSKGVSVFVLEGGLGKRARAALLDQIEHTPRGEPLVVVATGQYLGEGFDCPQLDTLFLAFPISFKGRLVQYTGRLMRAHEQRTSVRVYDYADLRVPVLRAMHARRLTTYKSLGFRGEQAAPALVTAA